MMNWTTAFMIGLAGSLHCLGMCGPLVLAVSKRPGGALSGRLIYHLGRVLTYAALGAVAGLIGLPLQVAGVQQTLSILMGITLLLFVFPKLGRFRSVKLQAWGIGFVHQLKGLFGKQLGRNGPGSMFVLGLLNGLLPCGLVYVALAGAVVTGGVINGAGFMAVFGFGTLPMMIAVSTVGMSVRQRLPLQARRVMPLLLLVIGSLLILRGLSLGIPYLSPDLAAGACCH